MTQEAEETKVSKRQAKQSSTSNLRHGKLEELKRAKQEGKSLLSSYKVGYGDIYEEVDEEDYQKLVHQRLTNEDDFVVDDDGQGYGETGLEIWDQPDPNVYSDEEVTMVSSIYKDERETKKRKAVEKMKNQGSLLLMTKTKPTNPNVDAAASLFDGNKIKDEDKSSHSNSVLLALMDQDLELNSESEKLHKGTKQTKKGKMDLSELAHVSSINKEALLFPSQPSSSTSLYSFMPTKNVGESVFERVQETTSTFEYGEPGFDSNITEPVSIEEQEKAPISEPPKTGKSQLPIKTVATGSKDRWKHTDISHLLPPVAKPMVSEEPFKPLSEASTDIKSTSNQTVTVDSSFIEEDGSVRFYWFDAFEKSNGVVLLLGKVWIKSSEAFVSACLTVKGIQRNLYFLARPKLFDDEGNETNKDTDLKDIYNEIASICTKHSISKFACKKVARKYAFELADIPDEADYLKVLYSYEYPSLPKELKGKSFSHVFGTNTNALEMLIIKKKLMGPCWLTIANPCVQKKNVSWTRLELEAESLKNMHVLNEAETMPSVTMSLVSLHIKTILNPMQQSEVVAASILTYPNVNVDTGQSSGCSGMVHAIRPMEGQALPYKLAESFIQSKSKVEVCQNERALLNWLLATIQRLDPDIYVGHNWMGYELPVLLARLKANKVERWSRMGRLHWSSWPKLSGNETAFFEKQIVTGRLVCDTYILSKDLVKAKNYSLKELATAQLQTTFEDLEDDRLCDLLSSVSGCHALLRHCERGAMLSAQLAFKLMMLPLTKQLTILAGNLWSHTMAGSRAERNEYLLLHEFHNSKFICPDKSLSLKRDIMEGMEERRSTKKKPAYAGGLVLEPKAGFYDKIVLLLDFNSLYPSIIQEFNICFTTVERDDSLELPSLPDKDLPLGLLPKLLSLLVSRRRQVKKLMADPKLGPDESIALDIRQKALKLTANSMYGCLGFPQSRFYAKQLAMLITAKGREILQATVDLAQTHCQLDVIYGDTDSIMISTGTESLEDAKKLGYGLKKLVNEKYKLLEIELDGIFKKLLLLKKKKYAALIMDEKNNTTHLEMKGLDLVRRDWCALSVDISTFILNEIMSLTQSRDELLEQIERYLTTMKEVIKNDKIPVEKWIIWKNLMKNPEDYADGKSQPHVIVALTMKAKGLSVRIGEAIPYVICSSTTCTEDVGKGLAQRAYHPDELKKNIDLKIDKDWYLSQQIFPPISRLMMHVEGMNPSRLAHCLGLDTKRFSSTLLDEFDDGHMVSMGTHSLQSDEARFRNCKKLTFHCSHCLSDFEWGFCLRSSTNNEILEPSWVCPNCKAFFQWQILYGQLMRQIRAEMDLYYQSWMICDEPSCAMRTRRLSVYEKRCPMHQLSGCHGSLYLEYTEKRIYLQLLYWKNAFDIEKCKAYCVDLKIPIKEDVEHQLLRVQNVLNKLMTSVDSALHQSSYPVIQLSKIFSFALERKLEPEKTLYNGWKGV